MEQWRRGWNGRCGMGAWVSLPAGQWESHDQLMATTWVGFPLKSPCPKFNVNRLPRQSIHLSKHLGIAWWLTNVWKSRTIQNKSCLLDFSAVIEFRLVGRAPAIALETQNTKTKHINTHTLTHSHKHKNKLNFREISLLLFSARTFLKRNNWIKNVFFLSTSRIYTKYRKLPLFENQIFRCFCRKMKLLFFGIFFLFRREMTNF